MARYILWRCVGVLAVLLVISLITFGLMHSVPGGPWDELKMPLSGVQRENMLRSYGLDKPLWQQYALFVKNLVTFDLGYSFVHRSETVNEFFARAWPISAWLGIMTMIVAFPLGLLLGYIGAFRQNTWWDYVSTTVALSGFVIPSFVLGVASVVLFSIVLQWLPPGGWDSPKHWILPVFVNCLAPMGIIARNTRAALLEVMRSDYVRTARAKGLSEVQVRIRHIFRTALIPIMAVAGPLIPVLITGSLFVETVFYIPGIGRYFAASVFQRDYPMIMATVLLFCALVGVVNLLTDILYMVADPRVRLTR
jgi:ABC-type dipeptide/oligopeptide/nickel transport system permease component